MPQFVRAVALAVALVVVAAPAAATAAADVGTDWWYERFGVAEVHAEGWDGTGVRVAVIDTQVNDRIPALSDASLTISEPSFCGGSITSTERTALHGTQVLSFLVGNGQGNGAVRGIAPGVDVTFYGFGEDECTGEHGSEWALAIDRAVADGAQIISISYTGTFAGDDSLDAVTAALAKGVVIVAALPNSNSGEDATSDKPAALNGVVSVAGFGPDGAISVSPLNGQPNIHPEATVVAPGSNLASIDWEQDGQLISGTSLATPMVAGILAATWQKYPDATGNQLIQSLIHNTTAEDHPLERDTAAGYGYGPASLRHMLAVDPTQYPDENPLMDKAFGRPTAADVREAAGASTAEPAPTDEGVAAPPADAGGALGWIIAGGAGFVTVVGLIAVITIVLSRRHARRSNGGVS